MQRRVYVCVCVCLQRKCLRWTLDSPYTAICISECVVRTMWSTYDNSFLLTPCYRYPKVCLRGCLFRTPMCACVRVPTVSTLPLNIVPNHQIYIQLYGERSLSLTLHHFIAKNFNFDLCGLCELVQKHPHKRQQRRAYFDMNDMIFWWCAAAITIILNRFARRLQTKTHTPSSPSSLNWNVY